MKKTKDLICLSFVVCALFFSCAYDNALDNVALTSSYFPLAIGNYWEFEVESYNSTTFTGLIRPNPEKIEVVDYKEINGTLFYEVEIQRWSGSTRTVYLRDTAGYIIDNEQTVWFSAIDRNTILGGTELMINNSYSYYLEYSVPDSFVFAQTPFGEFKCLDFQGSVWLNGEWQEKKLNNYYANGVGPVYKRSFSIPGTNPFEERKRLIKYHVLK